MRHETGMYPVICKDIDGWQHWPESEQSIQHVPSSATDAQQWFATRLAWLKKHDGDFELTRGKWDEDAGERHEVSFLFFPENPDDPVPPVWMLLVPAGEGYLVPEHIGMLGYDDSPTAADHTVILRSWYERYGAELIVLAGDSLELRVARPIRNRDEALEVAREHALYCLDCMSIEGSIDGIASRLLGSTLWDFWWD